MAPTRRTGRDQVAPVSQENSTVTAATAQDQLDQEMANNEIEAVDDVDVRVNIETAASEQHAQPPLSDNPHAEHTPVGSRASSVARGAFQRMGLETPAEKQLRATREALEMLYDVDIIALTTEQLREHGLKQAAYEQIIENHERSQKRKREESSMASASDSHANRMSTSKLDNLIKTKCPELASTSQSAFDTWRQLVNNKFKMVTGHEHDGTQRSRWALSGIKSELSTLLNPLAKACDEADEMGYEFNWAMVQELLQDIIKNPTVRRTELAIQYFNCYQKPGQSVQSFAEYLRNLEERMDTMPFEDGATKVDFYFAKLQESLRTKIIEQDLLSTCTFVKDLVANAVRYEQISKAAKAPAPHDKRTDYARESRADRGRGRGSSPYRGVSRGNRGRSGYGSGTNAVPQGPRAEHQHSGN
jgi:hypothetical protein